MVYGEIGEIGDAGGQCVLSAKLKSVARKRGRNNVFPFPFFWLRTIS